MDDALGVRGIQRIGNLDGKVEQRIDGQRRCLLRPGWCSPARSGRPCTHPLLQCLALQELHGDEGLTFVFVDFINGADVGMIERRGSAGLALEAAQGVTVFGQLCRQEVEGDETPQLAVLGLIDHTHTSAAELLEYAVMGNGLANHAEDPAFRGHIRRR